MGWAVVVLLFVVVVVVVGGLVILLVVVVFSVLVSIIISLSATIDIDGGFDWGTIGSPVFPKIAGKIKFQLELTSGVSKKWELVSLELFFSISLLSTPWILSKIPWMSAADSLLCVFGMSIAPSLSPFATMLWISSIVISRLIRSPLTSNV